MMKNKQKALLFLAVFISITLFSSLICAADVGQTGEEYNQHIDKLNGAGNDQRSLKAQFAADEAGYYAGSLYINGSSANGIFDSRGKLIYEAEVNERDYYANGYFIAVTEDDQYLKTAEGETVFSASEIGASGFGLLDTNRLALAFLRDGYLFAYKMEESISGVTYEAGIITVDKDWIVEMSPDMPLLHAGVDPSSELFETQLTYAGEGILLLNSYYWDDDYKYEYKLYSIFDNTCYGLNVTEGDPASRLWDYPMSLVQFENGQSIQTYQDTAYEFHTDGTACSFQRTPKDVSVATNWGSFFPGDQKAISLVTLASGTAEVISQDGTVIKELTGIRLSDVLQLDDGWLITVVNNEDSHYYAVVGLDGEFAFEPVKTDAVFLCLADGREIGFSGDLLQEYGLKQVIDTNGQVLYESPYLGSDIHVSNGIVQEEAPGMGEPEEDLYVRLDTAG